MLKKIINPYYLSSIFFVIIFFLTGPRIFAVNPQAEELYEKGMAVKFKDYQKSLQYFKDALKQDPDYVEALLQAGEISRVLDLYDQSEKYFKQAETLLVRRGETETENYVRLLQGYGNLYNNQWKNSSGAEYYEKALALQEKIGDTDTELYAEILISLSSVYSGRGDYDKAFNFTERAETILKRIAPEHGNMLFHILYKVIGNIYSAKVQPVTALDYYQKAKTYLEKDELHVSYAMAGVLNNFGWAYSLSKNLDRALEYYLQAYNMLKSIKLTETSNNIIILLNIVAVYYNKADWNKSLEYILILLSTMEKMKITKNRKYANALFNAGYFNHNLYAKSRGNKQLNDADTYYTRAKKLYEELNVMDQYYGILLLNLGIIAEEKGKKSMAGSYYRKAYNVFVQVGYTGPFKAQALEGAQRMGY